MLTNLQRRKVTRMFRHIDGDCDDMLQRHDYDRSCAQLVKALRAPAPNSREAVKIATSYAPTRLAALGAGC